MSTIMSKDGKQIDFKVSSREKFSACQPAAGEPASKIVGEQDWLDDWCPRTAQSIVFHHGLPLSADESATTPICRTATKTRFRSKGSAAPVPGVRAMGSQGVDSQHWYHCVRCRECHRPP